jgi:hypothetical protein
MPHDVNRRIFIGGIAAGVGASTFGRAEAQTKPARQGIRVRVGGLDEKQMEEIVKQYKGRVAVEKKHDDPTKVFGLKQPEFTTTVVNKDTVLDLLNRQGVMMTLCKGRRLLGGERDRSK